MSSKRRFKPKLPLNASTPKTMEETTITLPKIEEWDVEIGNLWNCRTNERIGYSIFNEKILQDDDHLEVIPVPDMQYKLTRVRDATEKSEILDISVEVKIDLPAFSVEGSVSFRKEDEKHFEQEEFFVQYNATTSLMRTRPSVQDDTNYDTVINKEIAERPDIQDGSAATHYVSEIRYGGWAQARFRLSDKLDHNLLDLSGSVGGSVPVFPGISVGLKASIGFMDQDTKLHFNKEIKIQGSPLPPPPSSIKTMADMFEYVEKLPGAISDATQKYPPDGRLKGIPISFKLSPLTYLIPKAAESQSYNLLEADLLQDVQDMIFSLNDFQMPNRYRSLIREMDPRLVIMFPTKEDEYDYNPWAVDVDEFQKELNVRAEELGAEVTDIPDGVLPRYKLGKATTEELQAKLTEFSNDPICHPTKVKAMLQIHVKAGKDILNVLRPADATVAGQPKLFEFNSTKWQFLITDNVDEGVRILVQTNGDVPVGFFKKLYSMIPLATSAWADAQLMFMVAAPNIVKDFSLALKANGRSAIFYKGADMMGILTLVDVIARSRLKQNTNTSRFYSIYSAVGGEGSGEQWNISDVDSKYTAVKGHFESIGLIIADNYLQTLQALTIGMNKVDWTLFLPVQFLTSLHDSVLYFRRFVEVLKTSKSKVTFRTIAGYFDTHGETGDAPLMIVLDRTGAVVAVVMDQLDLLLLSHHFTAEGTLVLDCLDPNLIGTSSLAPFRVDTALELCNIINAGDELKLSVSNDNPFLLEKPFEIDRWFILVREILEAASFQPFVKLVSCFCKYPAELLKGRLISILQKNGWDMQLGFQIGGEKPVWDDLSKNLQSLQGELEEEEPRTTSDAKNALKTLVAVVEYCLNPTAIQMLYDGCIFYINKLCIDTSLIREDLHKLLLEPTQKLYLTSLLKSLQLLQLTRCNTNYYGFWKQVDEICNDPFSKADNTANMTKIFELVSKFEIKEQQWIWNNPKFQHWTSLFLNSKSELAIMFKLFVPKNHLDEDVLPSWLPINHRKELLAMHDLVENPLINWKGDNWDSLQTMLSVFAGLIVNQNIPHNFTQILGENLKEHPELYEALKDAGSLFFWNDKDSHFTSGWGMNEIIKAFESLQTTEESRVPASITAQHGNLLSTNPPKTNRVTLTDEKDVLPMNSTWQKYTGGTMNKLTIYDFLRFQPSQYSLPLIMLDEESLATAGTKLLTYIISQIKQGNVQEIIHDLKVLQFLDYYEFQSSLPSILNEDRNNGLNMWTSCFRGERRLSNSILEDSEDKFYLSRSDLLSLVLNCGDKFVRNKILSAISKPSPFLHALPWLIPDATKETLETIALSESLTLVKLDEYFESNSLLNSRLLRPPYKLITAVRVGAFKHSQHGKSTLLNNSLLKSCTFSSKFESGYQNGPPVARNGLVELAWLSNVTTRDEFYANFLKDYYEEYRREMVLLANVHGDFLNMPLQLVASLRRHSGAFVVFWGCDSWKEMIALKPQLNKLLGKETTVYNIVVDPDLSIRKHVNKELIFETTQDDQHCYRKMETIMKCLIEETSSTTDATFNENGLVETIKMKTVQSSRRSLKLQNQNYFQNSDLEETRVQILSAFTEILNTTESSERDTLLYRTEHLLQQLSSDSNSRAIETMKLLSNKYTNQEGSKDFIVAALRAARHELNLNSISLTNLFRELNLEYSGTNTDYLTTIQDVFYRGYPVEFLNMNFTKSLDASVLRCFDYLEKERIQFLTVSTLGPQGSHKSAILNKLFFPGMSEGPFGNTNGIVMRLVTLDPENKPNSLNDIDAILLLDTEGIGRTDNSLDIESVQLERQLAALVLSMSHLCLITYGGDSAADWLSSLQGVMELSFLAQSTIFEKPSFPDIILVGEHAAGEEVPERNGQFREMLKSVSNITTQYPMQTLAKHPTIEGLQSTYTRILSDSLQHNLPQLNSTDDLKEDRFYSSVQSLRNKVLLSCGEGEPLQGATYLSKVQQYWQVINEHKSQFSTPTALEISQELNHNSLISSIKTSYERAYAAHEELLEDTDPNDELDFSGFNGIPHFCIRLAENVCDCKNQLEALETLEGKLLSGTSGAKLKLIQNDLDNYTKQLRSDVMSRMTQERYAIQIAKGTPDGSLNVVLRGMLATDPYPWVPFKQYVASLLNVSPWRSILDMEISNEYGEKLLEDINTREIIPYENLEAFDLESLGRWNQCPLDISDRVENLRNLLSWEEFIWLEIEVEREITRGAASYAGYGYKRGMLRGLRDKVDQLLGVILKSKLPSEFELSSKFISNVHFLAVVRFVEYWGNEWVTWLFKWDPLKLLEDREDLFPNNIFVGEKPEEVK